MKRATMRTLTLGAVFAAAAAAVATAGPGLAAGPAPKAPAGASVDAAGAFDRLKQLEGEWQGTTDRGEPMTVRFQVGAGGSRLTETQGPGTASEMVTVYTLDGGDLVLTHYCPMGPHGNQPHMRLDRGSKPGELDFVFTGGTHFVAAKDMHVHQGRIVFLGNDRIRREWSIYDNGRPAGSLAFTLSRKR